MGNSWSTEARLFGAKLESVPGSAETIAASDYNVRVRELALSSLTVEFDDESSKFATGDHTHDEAIAGVTTGGMDFKLKLAPASPTKGLPYGKLLQGAGLIEDASVSGVYVYTPGTGGDVSTLTTVIVDKESGSTPYGIEYKLAGAMSTLTIDVEGTGKPYMANFSFQGKVSGVTELTSNLPEYSDVDGLDTIADKFFNTIIRITDLEDSSTHDFCVNSFSLDTGLNIAPFNCQEDAAGILYNAVTSRDPRVTINPLLERLSDFAFWNAVNSEKVYKLEIIGNKIQIEVPRAQIISTNISDDNGFQRNELTMRPLRNINGTTQAEKESVYKITINE